MKNKKILVFLLLVFFFSSCSKDRVSDQVSNQALSLKSAMPHMKIMVMSGFCYLDPSLMVGCTGRGTDFRKNNEASPELLEFSKPILDEAISRVLSEKPDLLLIPGELTCAGEKISHEAVAGILKNISEQGIKVFVIPGNKDINNPGATAYNGSGSSPAPTVTAEEFETLYSDFGYEDAISRDINSLSYVAQPFNNIWILGIDARVYPIASSGRIKPETLEWIKEWLVKAKEKNITVLGLLHHSATEDWYEEAIYGPAYVIQNHETVENALVESGLRVIFTSHATDICRMTSGENSFFDVGTGSLLTPPFAYRKISMDPNYMHIETDYITSIDAEIPGGADFLTYSNIYFLQNLTEYFIRMLMKSYRLPLGDASTPGTATYYAPHFAKGLATYYAGGEQFPVSEEEFSKNWPEPYKHLLKSLYSDCAPADRQYIIDMRKKLR